MIDSHSTPTDDAPYPQRGRRYTLEEYLRLEELSPEKHEFHGGYVFGTPPLYPDRPDVHERIVRNTRAAVLARLESSRFRLVGGESMPIDGAADLSIVSVPHERPIVVMEVFSRASAIADRVDKFHHLRTIETFREYVLIYQTRHNLTHFERTPDDRWALRDFDKPDDVVHLASIDLHLPLSEVFAGVIFLSLAEVLMLPEEPERTIE